MAPVFALLFPRRLLLRSGVVAPRATGALVAAAAAAVAAAGATAGAASAGADRGRVLLRVKRPAGSAGGGSALLTVGRPGFLGASAAAVATGLAAFFVVVFGMLRGGGGKTARESFVVLSGSLLV
jgi:hypothetical protein